MHLLARRSRIVVSVAALACCGFVVGGCESGNAQLDDVRADLTPNLDTLSQRPEDMTNAVVLTADENGRMFWQDLGRALYVERPSRLTREPVWRP